MNWTKLISEQASSGLSAAEFCRKHGIKLHQLQYWKKKQPSQGNFVEVTAEDTELTFPNGVKVKVSSRTSVLTLKRLSEAFGC